MIITHLKRIARTGFINFWRNGFLSFSAVIVLTLSLVVFGSLIFGSAFGRALIQEVKNKVDINVYFTLNAKEEDILNLQKTLKNLPEVENVEYISRDMSLSDFKEKWKDNSLILQGLEEIGDNPFPAVLNIKAKEPSQYAGIAQFLSGDKALLSDGTDIVEKVNYNQNKLIIDRLGRIIPAVERVGTVIAIFLILAALIITFNTIRLIIFTSRDEISVMRLVGASNMYIRGPFVVSGIMYGIFSGILTLIVLGAFAYYSDLAITKFSGVQGAKDFDLLINVFTSYYLQNFGQIFLLIIGAGIIMGGISSYLAVRRYLRV